MSYSGNRYLIFIHNCQQNKWFWMRWAEIYETYLDMIPCGRSPRQVAHWELDMEYSCSPYEICPQDEKFTSQTDQFENPIRTERNFDVVGTLTCYVAGS